jgi:hypothetical protein
LLVVVFLLVLAWWGYLYFRTKSVTSEIATVQQRIITKQKQILADQNRKELLIRQGQLKAAETLLANHLKWSRLLPELARTSLRNASYLSFNADGKGGARMSVTVPDYKSFDQFLQAFDLPQYNEHFYKVTVSSVGKYQQGQTQAVRFEVAIEYDQNFLKADGEAAPVNNP